MLYVYCFVEKFVVLRRLNDLLFFFIKKELFYIAGSCQNTGACCKGIIIKYDDININSSSRYQRLIKKNQLFSRFIPHYNNTDITSFSCSSLSLNNLCIDYKTRPNICRDYPFSVFNSGYQLQEGCGFFIKMRMDLPQFSSNRLKQKIQCIKYNLKLV